MIRSYEGGYITGTCRCGAPIEISEKLLIRGRELFLNSSWTPKICTECILEGLIDLDIIEDMTDEDIDAELKDV